MEDAVAEGDAHRADQAGEKSNGDKEERGNTMSHRNIGVILKLEGQECVTNQRKGEKVKHKTRRMCVHVQMMLEQVGPRDDEAGPRHATEEATGH